MFTEKDRAQGRARMKQIAAENEIEIARIRSELIAGLVRAVPADQLLAEQIAVSLVRSRRLRSNGKDDSAERQLLLKLTAMWPAAHPAILQGARPEEAARCFERAAAGDECDRTPLIVKWPPNA
jgi:hypothetical protein